MHLFTIIQFSGLGLLWGVKESPAALAFPFFVVSMIALRWSLKFIFTEKELDHVRKSIHWYKNCIMDEAYKGFMSCEESIRLIYFSAFSWMDLTLER